jgi:hypothetical protein
MTSPTLALIKSSTMSLYCFEAATAQKGFGRLTLFLLGITGSNPVNTGFLLAVFISGVFTLG